MFRKQQPSLFSIHHDTPPFTKILLKETRSQRDKNPGLLDIKVPECRLFQDPLLSRRSKLNTKRESASLNRTEISCVSRSQDWQSALLAAPKQHFSPRIVVGACKQQSLFVDPESVAQPYEGPLRYGKFLVRVFDGNLRQIRPKSACRLKPAPRTFKARKSVMLSKPLSLTNSRLNEHRKSLRSEDLTLEALKQLSSEPKYPPIQNKNTSFTDLFHNFMKKMEKINSSDCKANTVASNRKSVATKNDSLSNRGTNSYNASIDSTKISISSRVCPPNSETISNEGKDSGRGRIHTPTRQKTPLMQKSRIEYSFRKAIKSEFKQIIKNSPLLASGEKKKKPTHRRVKSNGSDAPPKIVIIGTKATKGVVVGVSASPKTENMPRFSAKERKKIQQIIKIGKNCEVDLSKVNLSRRQKPYELAKSLERQIRQKADIHKPSVREQLINLNRVCLTLTDKQEKVAQSPDHASSKWRTITFSSNDSDLEDFFERELSL